MQTNVEDVSAKDLIIRFQNWFNFILSKWKQILLVVVIVVACGIAYVLLKPAKYLAEATFVLQEGVGTTNSGGIAAQLGLGMSSGDGGLFGSTDNILYLYTSNSLLTKTFLTPSVESGNKQLLINEFLLESGLGDKIKKIERLKNVHFTPHESKLSRGQSEVIRLAIRLLKDKYLNASAITNTENLISIQLLSKNELFSKNFVDELTKNVNEFYVETKIKKSVEDIDKLQHRADSIKEFMNFSIRKTANAYDATPNANPNLQIVRAPAQERAVDAQVATEMYSQMLQNIAIMSIALAKERPLVQPVDLPTIPLQIVKPGLVRTTILSFFLGGILSIGYLTLKRYYNSIMK